MNAEYVAYVGIGALILVLAMALGNAAGQKTVRKEIRNEIVEHCADYGQYVMDNWVLTCKERR